MYFILNVMFVFVFSHGFCVLQIILYLQYTLFASIIHKCSIKKPENIILFLDSFDKDR